MAPLVQPKKCHEECITFPSLAFKNNSKKVLVSLGGFLFVFFVKKISLTFFHILHQNWEVT